ncbi:21215_t:CDS:2 [Rhizophagus irregularis]|nr:21215_t:CDS:2 [Rhizophagus irregularis]
MTNSSSLIPVPIPIVELKEDTNSSSSKKSLVYQFFTYKSSRYYCNYCPSKSFSDKLTSTLWHHVNNHHSKIVAETQKQEEKIGEMDKFVVINDQLFNVTENKEFQNMMTFIQPGMHIPFADTVRRDLDENFKTAKNEVSGHLSFTVDAWTSKNQIPFLKIRSYTGANLSQRFLEVLQEFGITTKYFKKSTNFSTGQQYPTLSYTVPIYNYLLDKLEDEYNKKESEKGEKNEVVVALNELIEKIKRYYTLTVNSADNEESHDDDDEIFGHIFKKRKLNHDELSIYLNEKTISGKTDILAWWKLLDRNITITKLESGLDDTLTSPSNN